MQQEKLNEDALWFINQCQRTKKVARDVSIESFVERVAIKIESGMLVERARQEAYYEAFYGGEE